MAWSTPRTWAYKETLSSSDMNTYVKDQLVALNAGTNTGVAWTAYTPTITFGSGGPFSLGNGTLTAYYTTIGKIVIAKFYLKFGNSTTFNAGVDIIISLPVTSVAPSFAGNQHIGNGTITDAASYLFPATVTIASTTTCNVLIPKSDSTYSYLTGVGASVPMTWTTNDMMFFTIIYEAA